MSDEWDDMQREVRDASRRTEEKLLDDMQRQVQDAARRSEEKRTRVIREAQAEIMERDRENRADARYLKTRAQDRANARGEMVTLIALGALIVYFVKHPSAFVKTVVAIAIACGCLSLYIHFHG